MATKRAFRLVASTWALICIGALASLFHPLQQVWAQDGGAPTLAMDLLRAGVPAGGSTTLKFTVSNGNSNVNLTDVQVSDQLPAALVVNSPNNFQSTCNGSAIAQPGTGSITLSVSSLPAGAACTFDVDLTVAPGAAYDQIVTNYATPSAANAALGAQVSIPIYVTSPEAACAANTSYSGDRPSMQTYANPQPQSGSLSLASIFNRPVISRAFEGPTNTTVNANENVTTSTYAANLASMHPSYISSLVYINPKGYVTTEAQAAWYAIREKNPGVPLDVEISINPRATDPFPSAQKVIGFMEHIQCQLQPDAWFFDFYSDAANSAGGGSSEIDETSWLPTLINYAHRNNQLIGGNFFSDQGASVPSGTDFVAFVDDDPDAKNSYLPYGYGYDTSKIAWLNNQNVFVLGHLQSNPQNEFKMTPYNVGTLSCQYMNDPNSPAGVYKWTEPHQINYLNYWASGQSLYNFRFMYPAYYPICPAGVAYDPTNDPNPNSTTRTLFTDMIFDLMNQYNKTN